MKRQEEIERNVIEFIKKEKLIEKGDTIVVGVSGGADSVCLLEMLCRLRNVLEIKLVAAHLHHGIRGEGADRDLEYVREFCRERKVVLETRHLDIPALSKQQRISEEEAGRNARYEMFFETARAYGSRTLAVAHHREDQAETVLFRMARGTGLKGLCGMKAKSIREVPGVSGKFRVIRPLLCLSKTDLLNYLEENGIKFCEDETNKETEYTRNRIRLEILPLFQQYINPQTAEHIAQTAQMLTSVNAFVQENVRQLQDQAVTVDKTKEMPAVRIDLRRFRNAHEVLQAELLRQTVAELSGSAKDISREHIVQLKSLAEGHGGKMTSLPYGLYAVCEYDWLRIGKKTEREAENICIEIPKLTENAGTFIWEDDRQRVFFHLFFCENGNAVCRETKEIYPISQIIQKNDYTKCLDYGKIEGRLSLRYRRTGDEIQIGSTGHHKKLKRLFIDEKVPKEQRDSLLLLAEGNNVLWIPGLRMGDGCRVGAHTKQLLRVVVQYKQAGTVTSGYNDGG